MEIQAHIQSLTTLRPPHNKIITTLLLLQMISIGKNSMYMQNLEKWKITNLLFFNKNTKIICTEI